MIVHTYLEFDSGLGQNLDPHGMQTLIRVVLKELLTKTHNNNIYFYSRKILKGKKFRGVNFKKPQKFFALNCLTSWNFIPQNIYFFWSPYGKSWPTHILNAEFHFIILRQLVILKEVQIAQYYFKMTQGHLRMCACVRVWIYNLLDNPALLIFTNQGKKTQICHSPNRWPHWSGRTCACPSAHSGWNQSRPAEPRPHPAPGHSDPSAPPSGGAGTPVWPCGPHSYERGTIIIYAMIVT